MDARGIGETVVVTSVLFHVSPSANRESILASGLDWRLMGTELNIPGARGNEQDGIFLARDRDEAEWFARMGERLHETLDIWEVTLDRDLDAVGDQADPDAPCVFIDGFVCWTEPIAADRLRLAGSRP